MRTCEDVMKKIIFKSFFLEEEEGLEASLFRVVIDVKKIKKIMT